MSGRKSFWSWHDQIDNLIKLIDAAALFRDVTIRRVTRHFAVADAPGHAALGIEPDELLGFLFNTPQPPIVRPVVIVAPVTDDQHRGLAVHCGKTVFVELLEGATEIRVRKHVDDIALEQPRRRFEYHWPRTVASLRRSRRRRRNSGPWNRDPGSNRRTAA